VICIRPGLDVIKICQYRSEFLDTLKDSIHHYSMTHTTVLNRSTRDRVVARIDRPS